jgi:hypothetical protein
LRNDVVSDRIGSAGAGLRVLNTEMERTAMMMFVKHSIVQLCLLWKRKG